MPIPAGTFVMGRDPGHAADESPPHRVTISAFALEATLVTVSDFRRFVEEMLNTLREHYGALDLRSHLDRHLVGGPLYLAEG